MAGAFIALKKRTPGVRRHVQVIREDKTGRSSHSQSPPTARHLNREKVFGNADFGGSGFQFEYQIRTMAILRRKGSIGMVIRIL